MRKRVASPPPTHRRVPAGLLSVVLVLAAPLHAGNRALLIGTGHYANPSFNLTGIDLDLATMRHVARRLGFQDDEIRTLTDQQVTRQGVERAFAGFLHEAGSNDTVLVYYSGHGVQVPDLNGDEDDGRDEALTLHELAQRRDGYDGVLLDDDLSQMLAGLPSDNVMMIVDACHSGTVTRGITQSVTLETRAYGDDHFQVKALPFIDDPAPPPPPAGPVTKDVTGAGVVSLSAAQDHERALATRRGSTFTLALSEALETAGPGATFRQVLGLSRDIIAERVDSQYLFRPNLTGDEALFDRDMRVHNDAAAPLSNWDSALAIVGASQPADAALNAERFSAEETIELTFEAPADGYLNVLAVDADDALVLLHPNRHDRDNRVSAGPVSLPGPRAYEWVAMPPWGVNLIVAVFTREPVNLFDSSLQKRQDGESSQEYVLPFLDAMQQLGFSGERAPPAGTASAALTFETCAAAEACP